MPRKPKKGYYVKGHFVAEGSELDLELRAEQTGGEPSRTELKKASDDLQKLGEALLTLRTDTDRPQPSDASAPASVAPSFFAWARAESTSSSK